MSKKYTASDYEQMAKEAERKAREYKSKAKKVTEAEKAKHSREIIKAVEELRMSLPEDRRPEWSGMADYIRGLITRKPQRKIPVQETTIPKRIFDI